MEIERVSLVKQNRILVSRLAEAGLTCAEIKKLDIPNLPSSTIYHYHKKWQNDEKFDHREDNGSSSKLTNRDVKVIEAEIKKNPNSTCRSLSKVLQNENNKKVNTETIRRSLVKNSYVYKAPIVTSLLTEEHKLDRVEWAREHLTDDWSKIIFSDETSFWVDDCHVSNECLMDKNILS